MFYFQAADMVTQILNFGLPAQIDVRTVGYDRATTCRLPRSCGTASPRFPASSMPICSRRSMRRLLRPDRSRPGCAARPQREHVGHQHQCQPQLVRAGPAQFLDRPDVGHSLLYRGADAGVQGQLAERARQHAGFDLAGGQRPDRSRACSAMSRPSSGTPSPTNANQTNIQPVYEVYASVQGRDLGSVAADIDKVTTTCRSSSSPATRSR